MARSPQIPDWACQHWGGHEHDWLDCTACLSGYAEAQDAFDALSEKTGRWYGDRGWLRKAVIEELVATLDALVQRRLASGKALPLNLKGKSCG